MSTVSVVVNTDVQMIANFNAQNFRLGKNKVKTATLTNKTGSELTVPAGRLLGKVLTAATGYVVGEVKPHAAAGTNGTNIPVGFILNAVTLANDASAKVSYVSCGDVDASMITLNGAGTLATICTGYEAIGEMLQNKGLFAVSVTENTFIDNQ